MDAAGGAAGGGEEAMITLDCTVTWRYFEEPTDIDYAPDGWLFVAGIDDEGKARVDRLWHHARRDGPYVQTGEDSSWRDGRGRDLDRRFFTTEFRPYAYTGYPLKPPPVRLNDEGLTLLEQDLDWKELP